MGAEYFHQAIAVKTGGLFDRADAGSGTELECTAAALSLAELPTEPLWAELAAADFPYVWDKEYYEALGADGFPNSGEEAQKLWDDAAVEKRLAAVKDLIDKAVSLADEVKISESAAWVIADGWTVYETGSVNWGDSLAEEPDGMYVLLKFPSLILRAIGVTAGPDFEFSEVDALAAAVKNEDVDIESLRAAALAVLSRIHPELIMERQADAIAG